MKKITKIFISFVFLFSAGSSYQAQAETGPIYKCKGANRFTCVVDGDTIWLRQVKLRLKDFDTPEPQTNVCGGNFERKLANKASKRLIELLNNNEWTVEKFGKGKYGRTLATIRINGVDVGDILIRERLARSWPDGDEWWCQN
ncbi:MAG: thermonuclease family protein [Planctomycetaceae bacterium]|nr:thermonuclease family protein [Planctomycetaceae bacterium]